MGICSTPNNKKPQIKIELSAKNLNQKDYLYKN